MKYKYSIVIPCFNEENSVFKVVNTICIKFPNILVVVIDDGSTDNSYLELQKIKSKNLNLFKNENNYGKGYSIRKGLENIKNKSDIVIFTDADEEINIDDISMLISLYEKYDYDAVFGSRFLKMKFSEKVKMGFHRYLANMLLTKLSNYRLTDQTVALLIKKYLKLAGIDSKNYSGHSLRSGFATSAAEAGAEERSIMAMTGHKSTEMVRRYIKEANLFKNNALNKIKI